MRNFLVLALMLTACVELRHSTGDNGMGLVLHGEFQAGADHEADEPLIMNLSLHNTSQETVYVFGDSGFDFVLYLRMNEDEAQARGHGKRRTTSPSSNPQEGLVPLQPGQHLHGTVRISAQVMSTLVNQQPSPQLFVLPVYSSDNWGQVEEQGARIFVGTVYGAMIPIPP